MFGSINANSLFVGSISWNRYSRKQIRCKISESVPIKVKVTGTVREKFCCVRPKCLPESGNMYQYFHSVAPSVEFKEKYIMHEACGWSVLVSTIDLDIAWCNIN